MSLPPDRAEPKSAQRVPRRAQPNDHHGMYVEAQALLRFSVILPTYNRAFELWRAIQSVLAQTEKRWELIVVDSGSTDKT
jgi:hypothetical protein